MALTQRENFEIMVKGGRPEFAPNFIEVYHSCVLGTNNTDQPWQGGKDPFGVNWVATLEGVIPEPGNFMFDDIADWKKYIKFPDLNTLGIEQMAQIDLANYNKEEKVLNILSVCGIFERLAALMGFENGLCSLIEDPDSSHEFFSAFADYKIAVHNRFIEVYKPDVITYFDDVATARGLFMSPKTYRELIKPHQKRIVEAVTDRGVIFAMHTCGKCEDIVEDFVEIGAKIWNSAQIVNDLDGILTKYQGRLIVEGGWDSSGPVSFPGASEEQIIEETKRCALAYAQKGNYMLLPVLYNEQGNALMVGDPRLGGLVRTWNEYNKL